MATPTSVAPHGRNAAVCGRSGARAVPGPVAAVLAAVALLVVHGAAQDPAPAGPVAEGEARDLDRVVVFATSDAFYPYSYREADGTARGFSNDLTDAIARVMNLHHRRELLANNALTDALRAGRVDAIQFWGETPARRQHFDFSVPVLRAEPVVVVRRNETAIRTLEDLKGRRVSIGQKGTVSERYLLERRADAIPVYTETTQESLARLTQGEVDAVVMSRLTAYAMIDHYRVKNVKVLADRVQGYDVRYCYAVRKGDSLLLARINEGLAILHRTGEFDAIYQRWFGRYERTTFTPLQLISYVAVALALACAAATWGLLRQRALRKRIARQAAELTEQRSLLAALHEQHPQATLVLERPDGAEPRIVSLNAEAARLFGLDPKTATGRRLDEAGLAPDIAAYFRQALAHPVGEAPVVLPEHRLGPAHRLLETTLVPLAPGEAGVPRLTVLAADITARRLLDQEVAQSRRLRALGELVGGIAHEFNNLLTPIIGTSTLLLKERAGDPELQASLRTIGQAAARGSEMTRRLLTFGRRTESGATAVSVHEAVAGCFALLRPTVDRRIELRLEPGTLPPLWINSTDFNQIVFNLVINARDTIMEKIQREGAAGWHPCVRVSAAELPADAVPRLAGPEERTPEAWQRITVEDNGCGIPPENVERIFEPFFTTKEVGKGTGLGLATAWHLTVEAGGVLTVDSVVGVGSRFHVLLPRWKVEVVPAVAPPARAAPAPAGRRILVVEDDELVATSTARILRHLGHQTERIADGREAWVRLNLGPVRYDLLLLDLNLPGMSGRDLLQRLAGAGYAKRIVIMSGRVTEAETGELLALGAAAVVPKPFAADELTRIVEQTLAAA